MRGLMLTGSLVLVTCARLLPLSLGAVNDRAERVVREQVRERLAREIPQNQSPSQRNAEIDWRVTHWAEDNPAEFEGERSRQAAALKSQLRYKGNDGREYVYLRDYDSYAWLRHARNYLRTGTTCDAIVNGDCRDTYAYAPVGRHDTYSHSLHIAAIVLVHRIVTVFDRDYPLAASAFLVPVIIGALGVFPAFALGRRVGGDLGGLCAALLIGLNPIFLQRSMGSDDDVWNVVLPMFTVWATTAALEAATTWRQGILAIFAAVTALDAATWRGWLLTYDVLVIGLLATTLVIAARQVIRTHNAGVWQGAELGRAVLVLVVYCLVAGVRRSVQRGIRRSDKVASSSPNRRTWHSPAVAAIGPSTCRRMKCCTKTIWIACMKPRPSIRIEVPHEFADPADKPVR